MARLRKKPRGYYRDDDLDRLAAIRNRKRMLEDANLENTGIDSFKSFSKAELDEARRDYIFVKDSRLKPAKINEIRGLSHLMPEIRKLIKFLKDYQKYKEQNVRAQPGILLHGPPGTGKTLTARAIATESNSKLIDAGGFPRQTGSWTPEDMSSLFTLTKEYHKRTGKPVIIYFDEIDAVCPAERRYMVEVTTALLSELDGVSGKPEGVFVIASANTGDIDEGILRAGRLGQHLKYHAPGYKGRLEILKFYLDKKPHDEIDVEGVADIMPDFTPAEIEELVEKTYLEACFESPNPKIREKKLIEQLFEKALDCPSGTWTSEHERYRACVHEAGHVITGDEVGSPSKLAVVPKKGYTEGLTVHCSLRDTLITRDLIRGRITSAYGGELAEEIVFGTQTINSTEDIAKATERSIKLSAKWNEKTNYINRELCDIEHESILTPLDNDGRAKIYSEAQKIRDESYQEARKILEKYGKKGIEHVAKQIFDKGFLLAKDAKQAVEEARRLSNGGENQ